MSSAPNASGYEPMYPTDSPADATVKRFVTRFFEISDTPGLTDEWVEFFRDDATLVMGNDAATGRQQVRKLREGMWERVEARKHTLVKVFPGSFVDREFGGEENIAEFMLFGSVSYRRKGADAAAAPDSVDFAGHARLERDGPSEPWRFAYYRVYLQR